MKTDNRINLVRRRRYRIRKKVIGTTERPRMSVRFTGKNVYVQFIDDSVGKTLAAVSSISERSGGKEALRANVKGATALGELAAAAAKDKGISNVVFDRSGARYHGKVKALADAARAGGLEF